MLSPPWPTSSASLSTTPPSALVTSLPSPPDSSEKTRKAPAHLPSSVVQALDIVRACYQGHPPDDQWIAIHFQVGEYGILQWQLRQEDLWGYVEDKIRYDWNPSTGELIYRMPTAVHEIFTDRVVDEIRSWPRSLARRTDVDPRVCALASATGCRASTRILYRTDDDGKTYGEHSPDSSFGHAKAKYPSMVIETSFTQKRKDLPKLAEDYILGSQGNISVVIGLDIVYRGTKEATVSIWKPEQGLDEDGIPFLGVKTVVDAEPFRNSDGSPVSDGNLTLSLSDILPACMTTSITCPLPTFTIPYLKLAGFLQFGEASQQVTESESGSYAMELPIGTKIRRRAASPEETLSPGRERAFAKSEKQAEEQTMRDDGTYGQQTKDEDRTTELSGRRCWHALRSETEAKNKKKAEIVEEMVKQARKAAKKRAKQAELVGKAILGKGKASQPFPLGEEMLAKKTKEMEKVVGIQLQVTKKESELEKLY